MSKHPNSSSLPLSLSSRLRSLTIAGTHTTCAALLLAGLAQPALAAKAKFIAAVLPTPTVTLTFSDTTPSANQAVLITLKVTGATPAHGVVNFYDNSSSRSLLGTAQLTAARTAALKVVLGSGVHHIEGDLLPTTGSKAAGTAKDLTVTKDSVYADTGILNLTGTSLSYAATFYGAAAPTGSVVFTDLTNSQTKSTRLNTVNLTPSFAPTSTPIATTGTTASLNATVGDINNDGKPDLIATNTYNQSISVSLGNGDGTFQAAKNYAVGVGPYGVALGDFNDDGLPDLAVTNLVDGTVSILLNTIGTPGKLVLQANSPVVGTRGNADPDLNQPVPFSVVVADFDQDGDLDLVTTNEIQNSISILFGNGDGTFSGLKNITLGSGGETVDPFASVVADFDQDGAPDILVLNSYLGTVSLFLNSGTGTFGPAPTATFNSGTGKAHSDSPAVTGTIPYAAVAGDFNNDGYPDVAIANLGESTVTVLTNRGQNSGPYFTTNLTKNISTGTGSGPSSIAAINYANSGSTDLAVVDETGNKIVILTGTGIATRNTAPFTMGTVLTSTSTTPAFAVSVADFNGDGKDDFATTDFGGNAVQVVLGTQIGAVAASSAATAGHSYTAKYTTNGNDAYKTSAVSNQVPLVTASVLNKRIK